MLCRTEYVGRKVAAEKKVGDISCDLMRYKRETENLKVSLFFVTKTKYSVLFLDCSHRDERGGGAAGQGVGSTGGGGNTDGTPG